MNTAEAHDIRNALLSRDDDFRHLAQQHHDLDHRLHELLDTPHLSASEQLEEATLKKRKLALKDQMEAMARSYAGHFAS